VSSPTSPLRLFLDRFAADAQTLYTEAREQARDELAAELNLSVRCLRQSATLEELVATLGDTAAHFAGGAIVFRISDGVAKSEKMDLAIPLASAPALAGAVETRDPVTAVTTAGEVSAALAERLGHLSDGRAHIHPIVVKDSVPAILYAWGDVQGAAVELVVQVAAATWLGLLPAPPAVQLVSIAPQPGVKPASSWESLSPEDQRVHLRAQRLARVQVAAMRLQEGAAVQAGRSQGNLYEALRGPIDAARELFRRDFFAACPSMVDYLHLELVHTLANDDAELLGKHYPGPMV
jgi:hypothetical protein